MKLIPSISKALALLLIGAGMLSSVGAYAQNKVSGKVSDATGPLPGVTVLQEGTTNGTVTDIDGNWSLNVPEGSKLSVSFVGYKTEVITVGKQAVYNVVLTDDTTMLDEVVVTGYGGTQRRAKVTNSIAKVDDQAFKVGTFTNPASALSGAVSGLRVIQSSGDPSAVPTIVLRGGTNLDGSGSPLVVVDGQLRDSMEDINPEDIESMDVLKDAGATALYGARASNGVILITTKHGREGSAQISFKAKAALNYAYLPYEFCDARDYLYWIRKAMAECPWSNHLSNLTGSTTPMGIGGTELTNATVWNILKRTPENSYLLDKGWETMIDPVTGEEIIFKNTNPADYNLNNPALTQDYNASVSGGNSKGTYYAGLGYNNSDGLPRTTYYKRLSFVFNGSYKITDWLTSNSGVNFARTKYRSMTATQGNVGNYFGRIMTNPPTVRYEDEDGNPLLGNSTGDGNQNFQNDKFFRDFENDKLTLNQGFRVQFFKDLALNINGSWYYNEDVNESFNKDYVTNQAGTNVNKGRNSSAQFYRYFTQTYNATLNYTHTFADVHNLDVMVGAEYYDRNYKAFAASGQGAPTDDFRDLQYTDNGEGKRTIDSAHEQYRIMSYFGRLNYDYAGKYLLSATFREDGYSALLGQNRWGFFPGVSAGWVFSNEDFIKNSAPVISFGKIRASYGVNGNASGIGAYELQGKYGSAKYNNNVGFLIGTLPNPSLRWEKTTTFEVGADVSFFHNRLNANFTFYNRLTDDKYAALSLPSTTGFSSITNNNGQFRNRGIELDFSAKLIQKGDFFWDVKGNISYNKNTIVRLPENGIARNRQGGVELYTGNGNETDWFGGYQEGQEPGIVYGYVVEKIAQSENDFPQGYYVTSGHWSGYKQYSPSAYAALADKTNAILLREGDCIWKDINGDNVIDSHDQVVFGNTTPHWLGGFNTTFRWKNLTFFARMDFGLGFYVQESYDTNGKMWFLGCMQGNYNMTTDVWDTWTPENRNAKYPRYVWADQNGAGNFFRNSNMFTYKGDYLAIRELSLSYALPTSWVSKIHAKHLELSVTGQNLGYLTAAKVSRPELGTGAGANYGLPRTLLFGVNLVF